MGYLLAVSACVLCTAIGLLMAPRFDIVNIAMVYLLAVVLIALNSSRGAAVLCALLCVAAFDLLFVPPQGTFTVDDVQYLLTFAIMVTVALVISGLVTAQRQQHAVRTSLLVEAETERLRSTLLASISHDLRTPLTVMTGASSRLVDEQDRLSPSERNALARSIFDQARTLSDQVGKVLQMTRIETGAMKAERDWISISEIVGTVLARLSDRLANHPIVLDVPDPLPLIRADATLIEQALVNLLENAARHTPAGTLVRIRAQAQAEEMVVSVEDFGPGMDDNSMAQAFAKFHHGTQDGSARGAGVGVGLGLAIARAIITLHHGRAWAERIPGGGTAFRFTLPLEAQPDLPLEPEP